MRRVDRLFKQGNYDEALEELTAMLKDEDLEPSYRNETLNMIGFIYSKKGDLDGALEHFKEALAVSDEIKDIPGKATNLNNLGHVYLKKGNLDEALKYFKEALALNKSIYYPFGQVANLINIGQIHIEKNNLDEALEHLNQASTLSKSLDPEGYAKSMIFTGTVYRKKGEIDKALQHYEEALVRHEKSSNPYDIDSSLGEIYEIDPEKAFSLALESPLGRNWLFLKFHQQQGVGTPVDGKFWLTIWRAASHWWDDIGILMEQKGKKEKETTGEDWKLKQYETNWKLKQLTGSTKGEICSETSLNFLFGANDLKTTRDPKDPDLQSEQQDLNPLWFVEVPLKLLHGEKYLKIRLNNLVNRNGKFLGYPVADIEGMKYENRSLARIKLQLETQWFQKFEVDHIWYPNTQEEYEEYEKNPNCRLSDVFLVDLGENLKKEEQLELTYSVQLYFDAKADEPDIKTTTKRAIIPVIRNKDLQNLDRIRRKNEYLMTAVVAVFSLMASIIASMNQVILPIFSTGPEIDPNLILIGVAGLVVISIVLGLLLIRPKNKDKMEDKVQDTAISV
ncbi:MAG: tetratricopeptide repeat protein [Candidatus Odinarchaeota archaeon]